MVVAAVQYLAAPVKGGTTGPRAAHLGPRFRALGPGVIIRRGSKMQRLHTEQRAQRNGSLQEISHEI
jgi:hypothetical protein